MAYDKNFRPRPRVYEEVPTSEPVKDDMLIVSRKVYKSDGSVEANTWFYDRDTLMGWHEGDGTLTLDVATPGKRRRVTSYPLTELFWYAYEPESTNYLAACERWAINNFGVSYAEYKQAEQTAFIVERESHIKKMLRNKFARENPGQPIPSIEDINLDILDMTNPNDE